MTQDRFPVTVTTTTDHLSAAAEAILRRFPKGARPDKNRLLNDIAGALRPGKNWGGILAEGRDRGAAARPVPIPRARHEGMAQAVGALVRPADDLHGVLFIPPLVDGNPLTGVVEALDEWAVLGLALDIQESFGGGFDVVPMPDLIVNWEGRTAVIDAEGYAMPPLLARLVLTAIQRAWGTEWHRFLPAEGIERATLILGPTSAAAIVPHRTLDAIRNGRPISPLDNEAVRLFVPARLPIRPDELAGITSLVEAVLPELAADGRSETPIGPVRLEVHNPKPRPGVWQPVHEDLPVATPDLEYLIRSNRADWRTAPADPDLFVSSSMVSVMGEALAFIQDYYGVPDQPRLYIEAVCDDITSKRRTRLIGENWRILGWINGSPHEWRLESPEEHARLRRRLEAWLASEKAEFRPAKKMPSSSVVLTAPRSDRRNDRHWQRALGIFAKTD